MFSIIYLNYLGKFLCVRVIKCRYRTDSQRYTPLAPSENPPSTRSSPVLSPRFRDHAAVGAPDSSLHPVRRRYGSTLSHPETPVR